MEIYQATELFNGNFRTQNLFDQMTLYFVNNM